jgi:methylated-DNA-[protein]-cysteine S-methyltransferase
METITFDTPIGSLRATADDHALVELHFTVDGLSGQAGSPVLRQTITQLTEYFSGTRRTLDVPLAPRGTEFQLAVWNELLRIPYGHTVSYAEIAHRIGRPSAIRAVGAANGANPIPVIVPCHRVIGSNGSLTGYGGGIERKQWLLALEGRRLF